MKTYPKTASEYARQLNKMEGTGPNFMGNLVTDQAHWDDYGVHTGEDLARYLAWNEYMNLYKSVYGIQPRGIDYKKISIDAIKAETEELLNMSKHTNESLKGIKEIIKEELGTALKEGPPNNNDYPEDYKSVEETHIEEVLKELNKASMANRIPPEATSHPKFAYTLGYQRALKDVAEKLLGIIF